METILIVDDQDGIRLSLRIALQNEGFKVEEAVDGEEAVEMFRKIKPDLIILDIKMPKLNGYDACIKIREESSVPIIFLSSKDDEEDQLVGYSYGRFNVDYVTKTVFRPKVLGKAVTR